MGACYHIDTVTCDNCRGAIMERQWGLGWPPMKPGVCVEMPNSYLDLLIRSMPIQMGQAAKEMTDQQAQQWRDLAGL